VSGPVNGSRYWIDVVVETRAGQFWAVQAKAYGRDRTIRKADVDSFLAESSREVFAWRLLIATTDRLSANALRTLQGQEKPVGLKLISQMLAEQVEWPSDLDALEPVKPPSRILFRGGPVGGRSEASLADGPRLDLGEREAAVGTPLRAAHAVR